MTRTLIVLCVLSWFAAAQEVSADRAAAQSMKSVAIFESEKLLQNNWRSMVPVATGSRRV
jgi:hypothetical protein